MRPIVLTSLVAVAACASDATPVDEDYEIVAEGKEDSFRSPTAMEFAATADARVTLPESARDLPEADRLAQAQELVSAKLLQIGWFLNLYVADKEPEDANKSYGGFHAMARNASVKSLGITAIDAVTYAFNFEATVAAENKFLSELPGTSVTGGIQIELAMGKLSNDELLAGTWQGRFGVHDWQPSDAETPEDLEMQPMVVTPLARSANAFLDYNRLYADGKLEVGAQFGWDYNANRADLQNAEELYDDLLAMGFDSPVGSFKDLALDSPPLTRSGTFHGQPVAIEVKLVHPGMVADPAANAIELRNALLALLATKEVVLFNGHAGVSGRLLPADFKSTSAGNILPTEYPTLKLVDGYQLLLVEGCQTYARFTDGFRQNPLKRGPNGQLVNMDIVTSTSYTFTSQGAESMESILVPLVDRDASNIKPATWDDILRDMNAPPNETAFMGVNGIDNDPHAHPYARTDLLGASCTTSTACGGEGNLCLRTSSSTSAPRVCGSVCIDDAGCPSDFRCASIASSGTLAKKKACVAR